MSSMRSLQDAIASRWVEVVIEVPRGGLLKRDACGRVEFVSPFPCPFNYGSVIGCSGADEDWTDAVVLGPSLARGRHVRVAVRGVVGFIDAGVDDPKLVCSLHDIAEEDRRRVLRFFRFYAWCKRIMQFRNRLGGATFCDGWQPWIGH